MTPAAEARICLAMDALADAIVRAIEEEPPADQADRLLSLTDAAEALGGVSRSTMYREIEAGRLRSVRVAGRRMVPSSALTEYAQVER